MAHYEITLPDNTFEYVVPDSRPSAAKPVADLLLTNLIGRVFRQTEGIRLFNPEHADNPVFLEHHEHMVVSQLGELAVAYNAFFTSGNIHDNLTYAFRDVAFRVGPGDEYGVRQIEFDTFLRGRNPFDHPREELELKVKPIGFDAFGTEVSNAYLVLRFTFWEGCLYTATSLFGSRQVGPYFRVADLAYSDALLTVAGQDYQGLLRARSEDLKGRSIPSGDVVEEIVDRLIPAIRTRINEGTLAKMLKEKNVSRNLLF